MGGYNRGVMKLSVVIPVYNEVDNIREILKGSQADSVEIIVVDDGSRTGAEICRGE
jgi:glycosyltransferase involved in cell wall biosynthesis